MIGYNLHRALVAALSFFQNAVAPYDLTLGQYNILIIIHENEGLSQSVLGSAVGIDRSTMVAVIDRLERRGLVVRAPALHDRRSYALRLSPAGRTLIEELLPRVERSNREIVALLGSDEADRLKDCLRRLARAG